jgi:hypothetical protein
MSSSHVFFIPAMLLLGAILGYVVGRRTMTMELEQRRQAEARKAARRAARAATDGDGGQAG